MNKAFCENCNKVYQRNRDWQKFCSARCRTAFFRQQKIYLKKALERFKNLKESKRKIEDLTKLFDRDEEFYRTIRKS